MEFCTSRHFLLSIFILQLVSLSNRQVFDFLGFMWASVLANFLYTLFVIFGIFGVIQCRSKYTISYTVCSSFWFFWNCFVMCLYMNLFGLDREKDILSLGTGSTSWWELNGPGCKAIFSANKSTTEDPFEPIKPDFVTGCVIEYEYVEIIQAAVQAVLALWGCITGIKVSHIFLIQNQCSSNVNTSKKQNTSLPLYSIEYNPRHYDDDDDDSSHTGTEEMEHNTIMNGRRPMTPRRVKRRSIHSRGTLPISQLNHHQSHNFVHHAQHHQQYQDQPPPPYVRRPPYGSARSYNRSSLPRRHRSASNQSLEQRHSTFHRQADSSTSNDSGRIPTYSSHSQLLSPSELLGQSASVVNVGHSNPNFTSSTSLDRPPSVRSSYSNFHGVRTFSYTNQATPQVPPNPYRRSIRPSHSSFFSNGPPAYEIQGCVDSETVI